MTYSLIAREPDTGEIGIIVASRFFACGAIVPFLGRRTAVATQSFVNPLWGTEGRRKLEAGETAQAVINEFAGMDDGRDLRQCHMMDNKGNFAAYTGADCVDWAGHKTGTFHSVAGNMLFGPDVVAATFETYELSSDLPMAERLIKAMRAGEIAGGDKRGKQAAGMVIHRGQDYAYLDVRADDHADPLGELERLVDVASERYLHVADAMPDLDNFSGCTDRGPIDEAIFKAERERQEQGFSSRSHATTYGSNKV